MDFLDATLEMVSMTLICQTLNLTCASIEQVGPDKKAYTTGNLPSVGGKTPGNDEGVPLKRGNEDEPFCFSTFSVTTW